MVFPAPLLKATIMEHIDDLMKGTEVWREIFTRTGNMQSIDDTAPETVKQYNAVTWVEDCFYHTLVGDLPDGVWTIGRSKQESWEMFDKEMKARLQPDGTLRKFSQEEYERIFPNDFDREAFVKKCKEQRGE